VIGRVSERQSVVGRVSEIDIAKSCAVESNIKKVHLEAEGWVRETLLDEIFMNINIHAWMCII
jgi:hypothetical protein